MFCVCVYVCVSAYVCVGARFGFPGPMAAPQQHAPTPAVIQQQQQTPAPAVVQVCVLLEWVDMGGCGHERKDQEGGGWEDMFCACVYVCVSSVRVGARIGFPGPQAAPPQHMPAAAVVQQQQQTSAPAVVQVSVVLEWVSV